MIAETKMRVSQLLEINRALTEDLDLSRREAARLARERDALHQQVEALRGELERARELGEESRAAAVSGAAAEEEQRSGRLRREFEALSFDCEAARARAYRAEERCSVLGARLRALEDERDDARDQLEEANLAMSEIRRCLALGLSGAVPLEY